MKENKMNKILSMTTFEYCTNKTFLPPNVTVPELLKYFYFAECEEFKRT